MTFTPRGCSAPVVLKDSYGFEVKSDYHDLFRQYAPIWKKEEVERCNLWASFLLSFAPDEARNRADSLTEERRMDAACEHGLPSFLTALAEWQTQGCDGSNMPPWLPQLRSLIQAGVPRALRGRLWLEFLGVPNKRVSGLYDSLVQKALGGTKYGRKQSRKAPSQSKENGARSSCSNASSAAAVNEPGTSAPAAPIGNIPSHDSIPVSPPARVDVRSAQVSSEQGVAPESRSGLDLPEQRSVPEPAMRAASAPVIEPTRGGGAGRRRQPGPEHWHPSTRDWNVQIEKDLHRTFPGHPLMNRSGRCALRRILAAYSRHNDSVGYCQGMNFVAGAMLLFMREEDAFWCLCAIVEDLLDGYFRYDLIAPQVDQLVFEKMVNCRFPTLCTHLQRHGVDVSSMAINWFLTMFVTSLPLESTLRVWDVLFFENCAAVLFRCGLALVDIYAQALMATVDSIDAFSLLHSMAPMSFDASRLIDMTCLAFSSITMEHIHSERAPQKSFVLSQRKECPLKGGDAWESADSSSDDAASNGALHPCIDSPSALAADGEGQYGSGSGSEDSSDNGDISSPRAAPQYPLRNMQRTGSLEDIRKYVTAVNSATADCATPDIASQRPQASALEGPRIQSHMGGPGQASVEGHGTAARDGGLHAAMGAASAVSKHIRSLGTPESVRRSLFGRTRKGSLKRNAMPGVLGAHDDRMGSIATRNSAAVEAAKKIAATPFKTPPKRDVALGFSSLTIDSSPVVNLPVVNLVASGSLQGTGGAVASASAQSGHPELARPSNAVDRTRRHIIEASSVAHTLNSGSGGRKTGEEHSMATAAELQARHAAAMAQILSVVEGLEEELHAAEVACHQAERDAEMSVRNAKDARVELDTAQEEIQQKTATLDRLHDKLLGVTNTLAFFDSQLETKERALAAVRNQLADRDMHIAHKDSLIAQLQANLREKSDAAGAEAVGASPLPSPSAGFFRKLRSSASSDGAILTTAPSGGSVTGLRWSLRSQPSADIAAPAPEVQALRSSGSQSISSAPHAHSNGTGDPSSHVAFQPRNLDESLPPKPVLQPLIVSTARATQQPVKTADQ